MRFFHLQTRARASLGDDDDDDDEEEELDSFSLMIFPSGRHLHALACLAEGERRRSLR